MLCDGNMFHTIHVVEGLGKNRAAKFTIPQYECRENLRRTKTNHGDGYWRWTAGAAVPGLRIIRAVATKNN
ncbi:unnamed protein product [Brassica napus]|uniref:(rape) hypothetical protein n=1 Tax=Brassica napus TaxID=3708 RepID=A0A816V769_BRANA|nr:unnamed protein product [Brassica napus]